MDDIDGTELPEDVEAFPFGWDGTEYRIDVTEEKSTALVADIDKIMGELTEVSFMLNGESRTVWVTEAKAKKITELFEPFVEHGEEYVPEPEPAIFAAPAKPKKSNPERLARIRKWARENGHEVKDQGKIARVVMDAYARANPNDPE
ncbi:Lsr2 family DNA-binding protein [Streptomyces sp. NPDC002644]